MTAIAVLGGADGSISTIRTAQAMGLRTICVDIRTDAPGAIAADELVNISTHQVDALADVLGPVHDLAAVVSPACDVNLPTQYALARALNLPCGLSAAAVRASVDKGFFREVCDRLGLAGPRFVQGHIAQVADAAAMPASVVMVKPSDSSGSRGVQRISDPAELPGAVDYAATFSPTGVIIVEEYLSGHDLAAEAVVVDGIVTVLGVTERQLTPPPYFVTVEHRMPTLKIDVDELRATLDALCDVLEYRWGALSVDLIHTEDGRLVVLEWGARLGGNGMPELVQLTCGVDAIEAYVRMSLGEVPDLEPRFARHAGMRVISAPFEGKLTTIGGIAEARALDSVADIVLAVTPGEHVVPYTRAGAKIGYVLVRGDSAPAIVDSLDAVDSILKFTIEDRV